MSGGEDDVLSVSEAGGQEETQSDWQLHLDEVTQGQVSGETPNKQSKHHRIPTQL